MCCNRHTRSTDTRLLAGHEPYTVQTQRRMRSITVYSGLTISESMRSAVPCGLDSLLGQFKSPFSQWIHLVVGKANGPSGDTHTQVQQPIHCLTLRDEDIQMIRVRTVVRFRMRRSRQNASPWGGPERPSLGNSGLFDPTTISRPASSQSPFSWQIEMFISYLEAHDLTNSNSRSSLFELDLSKFPPNQIEIDHYPLDLYLLGNERHAYRPSLVAVRDVWSRMILGWTATFS
jgi:hypothetical protein